MTITVQVLDPLGDFTIVLQTKNKLAHSRIADKELLVRSTLDAAGTEIRRFMARAAEEKVL